MTESDAHHARRRRARRAPRPARARPTTRSTRSPASSARSSTTRRRSSALDTEGVRADRAPVAARERAARPTRCGPASTATRCWPRRPRPKTAASGCRASSARRRDARSRSRPTSAPGSARARDVLEEHLAAHRRARSRDPRVQPRARRRGARRGRRGRRRGRARRRPGPLAGVPDRDQGQPRARAASPTTCSSRILEGWRPPYDATVVRPAARRRARSSSARPTSTSSRWARRPRTRRSGRRATRTTRRACPAGRAAGRRPRSRPGSRRSALGSDTGGSIRQPAALCGVVGVKPTYGAVSRYGLVAFASSLDQIGPFADHGRRRRAAARGDLGPRPAATRRRSTEPLPPIAAPTLEARRRRACASASIEEMIDVDGIEPEVRGRGRRARPARSTTAGAKVERVSVPSTTYGLSAYYLIAPAEASSNLARYDGVRYGLRVDARRRRRR